MKIGVRAAGADPRRGRKITIGRGDVALREAVQQRSPARPAC